MTRFPFPVIVIAFILLTAVGTLLAFPGRTDISVGATLGMVVTGLFAAVAVSVMSGIKAASAAAPGLSATPEKAAEATAKMMRAFTGLMLARMVGYGALAAAVAVVKIGNPVSVCAGLVGGTLVFQAFEIIYLRKLA